MMKKKETLFSVFAILIICVVIAISLTFYFRSYTIAIYKKYPASGDIAKFKEDSKVLALSKEGLRRVTGGDKGKKAGVIWYFPHPYCGFKPEPNITIDEGISTNDLGYISPPLGVKKPGVIRIAMLGGSTVMFGYSKDTVGILGHLAEMIEASGKEVEYINAGVMAAISNQEVSMLVHDLLDQDVDLLITLDGFNDMHNLLFFNGRIGWPCFGWDDKYPNRPHAPAYYPRIDPLRESMTRDTMDKALHNYGSNINKIAGICYAFGIKYLAVLQPLRDFNIDRFMTRDALPIELIYYLKAIDIFKIWDAQNRWDASYVSMADSLNDNIDVFTDVCHFNDEGNKLVAEMILQIIKDRKILDL